MTQLRALKILLFLVGLALVAGTYPLVTSLFHLTDVSAGDQMILAIYVPIGIFLLIAVRNPPAHRSLIACFAWSTIAHAAVMAVQAFQSGSERADLPPLSVIGIICVVLIVLTRAKQSSDEPASANAA
ncbi:MAG: DUF6632 domain-containing protein [Candidatus Korobacteraceae bacterium]